MSSEPSSPSSDPSVDKIQSILFRFEEAWQADGARPDVREVYSAHQDCGLALLRQLVVLNYDLAWEAYHGDRDASSDSGAPEPRPAKVYRKAFPELDGDDDLLLELLLLEIMNWENPDEQYYVESYPRLETPLRSIFEILRKFAQPERSNWKSSLSQSLRARKPGDPSSAMLRETAEDKNIQSESPLQSNATITLNDSCRIVGEKIGEGSFKRVYQGIQASTGRAVAVKQLMRLTKQNVRNFVSEGRAQAGLDHQNIPPIILLGDQEGEPTLLLEKLIRAPDWSATIRDRSLRSRNLDILLTVSRAAEYAHRECSLVHRDIKPQNVLVGEYREVYLVDWGLAVQVGDNPKLHESVRQLKDEPDSYIIGPTGYMAPEMALGRNHRCTPATDVFMLGAVLYEILSGRPPYDAYPRTACFRAAAHIFPDLPADTPEELKAITLQAMAYDPAMRFRDAGDFADALERYLSHREAENQYDRADAALRAVTQALNGPAALRPSVPELLTSLIAAADQFRQAADLWQSSSGDGAIEPGNESSNEPGNMPGNEPGSNPGNEPGTETSRTETSNERGNNLSPRDATQAAPVGARARSLTDLKTFTVAGIRRSRLGECQARERLVAFAIDAGDLALAESQAHVLTKLNSGRAAEIGARVQRAIAKRRLERRQKYLAATAATLMLVVASVFWWQRTAADLRAKKSEADKIAAEEGRKAAEAGQLAAEEREGRVAAEKTASEERARRIEEASKSETLRANLAEIKRLDALAASADSLSFNQASLLFRAELLSRFPENVALRLVEIRDQQQVALLPTRSSSLRCPTSVFAISPDGKWWASGDLVHATVRVWSTENWSKSFDLTGHDPPQDRPSGGFWGAIRGIAFDPRDANVLYSAALDGTVRAWNLKECREIRRFTPAQSMLSLFRAGSSAGDAIFGFAVRPRQQGETKLELAIGNQRGEIVRLDADQLRRIKRVKGHAALVTALTYSPDGSQLASASLDGQLKVWNRELDAIKTLAHPEKNGNGNDPELLDVVFSPDGRYLAASGDAVTIPIWETGTWSPVRSLSGHPKSEDGFNKIYDLLWETDQHLISAGADGVIRRWQPQSGELLGQLRGHAPNMYGRRGVVQVAVDSRGQLISAGRDLSIRVWSLEKNEQILGLEGADLDDNPRAMRRKPMHVAYATDVDELLTVSASIDQLLRRFNASTLREIPSAYQFPELPDVIEKDPQGLAVSPDGTRFAVSFISGQIGFWSIDRPAIVQMIQAHKVKVDPLVAPPSKAVPIVYAPAGNILASLSNDQMVKFWDAKTFALIREWALQDVEFPIVSDVTDEELQKTSAKEREKYRESSLLKQTDSALLFIDANRFITAGRDNLVRIWDGERGEILQRIDIGSRVTAIAFDATSHLLAIGGATGDIWMGDITDVKRVRVRNFLSLKPVMGPSQFGLRPRFDASRQEQGEALQANWAPQVISLALSPGGKLLAGTLGDGSLTLVDVSTREPEILGRSSGHTNPRQFYQSVQALFTKQGELLTIGDDRLIRHWDFNYWKSGRSELARSGDFNGGTVVVGAPDGKEWIYSTGSGLARWPSAVAAEPVLWTPDNDSISSIAAIPNSDDLLLGTNGGAAIRFSRVKNAPVFRFPSDPDEQKADLRERHVAVSSDGKLAALSLASGQVQIWKLAERQLLGTTPAPAKRPDGTVLSIEQLAFHPGGTQLAVTDEEGTLRIWDLQKPTVPRSVAVRVFGPQFARGLRYTPDGTRLVMAGMSQQSESIVIWETKSFQKVRSLTGHRPIKAYGSSQSTGSAQSFGPGLVSVKDIAISSDGRWLASCATDATVRIWRITVDPGDPTGDRYEPYAVLSTLDLVRLAKQKALPGGRSTGGRQVTWVNSVAFQADNRALAVTSEIGPVWIYDLEAIQRESEVPLETIGQQIKQQLGIDIVNDRLRVRDEIRFVAPIR